MTSPICLTSKLTDSTTEDKLVLKPSYSHLICWEYSYRGRQPYLDGLWAHFCPWSPLGGTCQQPFWKGHERQQQHRWPQKNTSTPPSLPHTLTSGLSPCPSVFHHSHSIPPVLLYTFVSFMYRAHYWLSLTCMYYTNQSPADDNITHHLSHFSNLMNNYFTLLESGAVPSNTPNTWKALPTGCYCFESPHSWELIRSVFL